jgi:hypothetical protein
MVYVVHGIEVSSLLNLVRDTYSDAELTVNAFGEIANLWLHLAVLFTIFPCTIANTSLVATDPSCARWLDGTTERAHRLSMLEN